jgi:hypothetical protein
VRVEPTGWIAPATRLEQLDCDYVGGRVLPIWGGPRPAWLPTRRQALGGDRAARLRPEPIEFGARVPLGVNMAFRASAFERAGCLDPHTGRKAGTLLGQEVREWCIRARAAGCAASTSPEWPCATSSRRRG